MSEKINIFPYSNLFVPYLFRYRKYSCKHLEFHSFVNYIETQRDKADNHTLIRSTNAYLRQQLNMSACFATGSRSQGVWHIFIKKTFSIHPESSKSDYCSTAECVRTSSDQLQEILPAHSQQHLQHLFQDSWII